MGVGGSSLSPTRPIFGSIDVAKTNPAREVCRLLCQVIHVHEQPANAAKQASFSEDLQTTIKPDIPLVEFPVFAKRTVVDKARLEGGIENGQVESMRFFQSLLKIAGAIP